MLNLVLFGPPGAGKGTQADLLRDKYDLVHLSTGDIFRYHIKNETDLGLRARDFIDAGKLVPDALTIEMLQAELSQHTQAAGFIFDGFPRTIAQAEALDELLEKRDDAISLMLALEVSEEELRKRLRSRAETSGRSDDADPEVIQQRINTYREETAPVMEYYRAQHKLAEIDGEGPIDTITARLYKTIDDLN